MTNDEQKLALDLLWYELWMFNETSKYLILHGKERTKEKNVYLESFLLHTRNIVDFLEDKKYCRDIRCSDFEIDRIFVCLPHQNTIYQINKWLSHITKKRIQQQKPPWQYLKIQAEVNKKFSVFLNQVSSNCFPSKRVKNKSDFEALLNQHDRDGSGEYPQGSPKSLLKPRF